ncbi:MAG: glycosyl transferase [Spirochaetes bacterium]|nr:glycosyl transferase [Spirochaetota bacterium]
MKYGFFDDEKREYIITNPQTPVKWINYIGTLKFGGFVDHTGGILLCKGDPSLNRITKYIPQLPASDFRGTGIYLRIKENNSYKIFSPLYTPTLDKYDLFECHVGLQYTKFITEFYGIHTELTVFVPDEENAPLILDVTVKNITRNSMEIDLIPAVEYTHFDALKQFTNSDWVPQTMMSRLIEQSGGNKILTQYAFMNKDTNVNYFTSNRSFQSFETDRKIFLGANEYSSWAKPLSLMNEELSCTQANRGDNIAAVMQHLGEIKPDGSVRTVFQLGQVEKISDSIDVIEKYRDEIEVDKAFMKLNDFWNDHLSFFNAETPDQGMNSMLNIHNSRQCYITKNWSRYLSLYQLGLGSRGIGYRDSMQDVMGITTQKPEEARELIEQILHVQKSDGSAMHQFNPLNMIASIGDAEEKEDRPDYYGDDHLWGILAVSAYVKETGNFKFLDKIIPYYEKDKNNLPVYEGSVWDHMKRALDFTSTNIGIHKLPLLGFADWNDTVNLKSGAESVFNACLYGTALKEFIDIALYLDRKDEADRYGKNYELMKEVLNKEAWDGEWFIRYFDWDGTAIGSKKNKQGKIYTNAQSWPVISGFADSDKAVTALDSVRKMLNTPFGIKLSTPGYDGYDPEKGGVTTYPPGAKENGGIFLHANPWVIIAETILGRGNNAFEYYNQLNPASKNEDISLYECEPYCYAQNILGDEHPQAGLARNSWLSGTSSWMYQAATKYILGILPVAEGLKINPCIPEKWDGFKIIRKFRGSEYHIIVKNPDHVSKGIKKIIMNGREISGQILPEGNHKNDVEVIMG